MPQRTSDLAPTGRILIWTLRHLVRNRRRDEDLPGFVLRTLKQLPGGDRTGRALEGLLARLLLGASRPLAIRAPEATGLSRDEAELLCALVAPQLGLPDEARTLLAAHQRRGDLPASCRALEHLAAQLADQRLQLFQDPAAFLPDLAFTKQNFDRERVIQS